MRIQVEQLEKEKKELAERLRIVAKRVDHIERAYRKAERPLLAQDYADQQVNDRITFERTQKDRVEGSRLEHQHNLETKKRLLRMMPDYEARRDIILGKKKEDHEKKKKAAEKKIEEEIKKRRNTVLKAREEQRLREEEEERVYRQQQEEEARLEAGMFMSSSSLPCIDLDFKNAWRKKSAYNKSERKKKLQRRPRRRKLRPRALKLESNVNRSGRLQQRLLVCGCNVKKRLRSVVNLEKLKSVPLNSAHRHAILLLRLQLVESQAPGDAADLEQVDLAQLLHLAQRVRRARHQRRIDPPLWQPAVALQAVGLGVNEKQLKRLQKLKVELLPAMRIRQHNLLANPTKNLKAPGNQDDWWSVIKLTMLIYLSTLHVGFDKNYLYIVLIYVAISVHVI